MENDNKDMVSFNGDSSILEEKDPLLTHICNFCGKRYSSGKALGGHRRFHLQQERRAAAGAVSGNNDGFLRRNTHEFKIKAKNPQSSFVNPINIAPGNEGNNNKRCCICDKDFSSTKALSGHMRSHPERAWRGIQPPTTMTVFSYRISSCHDARKAKLDRNDEEEYEDEDEDDADRDINNVVSIASIPAVNLLENLSPSWSKTDRRGRTGNPAVAAADGLIDLSRSKSDWDLKKKKKLTKVKANGTLLRFTTNISGGTCNSEEKQLLNNIEPCDNSMKEKKNQYCSEEKKRKVSSIGGNTGTDQENLSNKKVITTNLFKCISCERSFPTYQALGGHRSTHNKDNKKSSCLTYKQEFQAVETMTKICWESEEKISSSGTLAPNLGLLDVTRILPTELADSNMTRILPTELADSNMTDASSLEVDPLGGNSSTTQTGDRRMPNFDLNELPCVMVGNEQL